MINRGNMYKKRRDIYPRPFYYLKILYSLIILKDKRKKQVLHMSMFQAMWL
jgi:hypothetical protein